MLRRLTSPFLTLLLLAACTPAVTATLLPAMTSEPVPLTPSAAVHPSEPPISATPETGVTPQPTLVFPTALPPADTLEPSATPQLSPARSSAVIQILSPGPLSKVLSPITMRGYIIPGARDLITVELFGEDDRLIFRKVMTVFTEYKWAYFSLDIPYETHAAAELGRLQVSIRDEQGNTSALLAVHLLLQQEGYEELNPPGNLDERCTLLTPLAGMEANGGMLTVGGQFRPFNTQPLILELVSEDRGIVTNKWIAIPETTGSGVVPFSAALNYLVEVPTSARLVIRQFDNRIDGNMYLFSQPVLLNP